MRRGDVGERHICMPRQLRWPFLQSVNTVNEDAGRVLSSESILSIVIECAKCAPDLQQKMTNATCKANGKARKNAIGSTVTKTKSGGERMNNVAGGT